MIITNPRLCPLTGPSPSHERRRRGVAVEEEQKGGRSDRGPSPGKEPSSVIPPPLMNPPFLLKTPPCPLPLRPHSLLSRPAAPPTVRRSPSPPPLLPDPPAQTLCPSSFLLFRHLVLTAPPLFLPPMPPRLHPPFPQRLLLKQPRPPCHCVHHCRCRLFII